MRGRCSRGSPRPCRWTSNRTRVAVGLGPPRGSSRPRGVCWIALTIRLSKTCSIRSRSTMTRQVVAVDLGLERDAGVRRPGLASARRPRRPARRRGPAARSSLTRPCSIRVRSSRSLIIARMRSASCRAASSSSTCLGVSGPTTSSSRRWTAICTLVSGVFSSWLTVETMSLLSRSSRWNLVTSTRSTAAPISSSVAGADRHDAGQEVPLLAAVGQRRSPARASAAGSRPGRRARR